MRIGTKKVQGRGRPPTYDRNGAARAIRDTFWRRGFAATSLDELAAATGMGRPSLYGAFGDKRAMYLGALERFAEEMRAAALASLAAPRLCEALQGFYTGAIATYTAGPDGARGCLVLCTAAAEAAGDAEVRAALAQTIAALDAAFVARFEQGREDGELARDAEPRLLGRLASCVLQSIALRARAGASPDELRGVAEEFVRSIATTVAPAPIASPAR